MISQNLDNMNDDEETKSLVQHSFSQKAKRILEKSGVPHSAFLRSGVSIDIEANTKKIECELDGMRLRKASVERQLKYFKKTWDNPLWGSYIYVISSYPTDLRAKHVALALMARAMDQYYQKKRDNKVLIKRSPPVWHNVMSGFKDKLLDYESIALPSFVVLSNVTEDSTQLKMEKFRDLLVKYDNIPRIVTTCACDPITFMLGKIRHHCDGVLYLSPDDIL